MKVSRLIELLEGMPQEAIVLISTPTQFEEPTGKGIRRISDSFQVRDAVEGAEVIIETA